MSLIGSGEHNQHFISPPCLSAPVSNTGYFLQPITHHNFITLLKHKLNLSAQIGRTKELAHIITLKQYSRIATPIN